MKTTSIRQKSSFLGLGRLLHECAKPLTRLSLKSPWGSIESSRRLLSVLALVAALASMTGKLSAQSQCECVTVNIYAGFEPSGGGAPYSDLVGSFPSATVSFGTDTGFNWHPFGLDQFGADITGSLSVAAAGTYTFSLTSDDGSLLFIDGSLVVDDGDAHPPTTVSASVALAAGVHSFEVQFFECCGGPSGVDLILPPGVSYQCSSANKCPLSQGYWRTHPALWPVDSLTLGTVTYTKDQLIAILSTPVTTDASVILAKQLIAALLNLDNGSDPTPVCSTIADANALLDGCTVPCKIDNKTQPTTFKAMVNDAAVLDKYNSGALTPGCTP
jgi:hypothetical protein